MAERVSRPGYETERNHRDSWTGDVWRLQLALQEFRPELTVRYLDCPPTGLVAISGLDPKNETLRANYDVIVARMMALSLDQERLVELWAMHPFVRTLELQQSPGRLNTLFQIR
jgi:hypothetical protein